MQFLKSDEFLILFHFPVQIHDKLFTSIIFVFSPYTSNQLAWLKAWIY